jgi:hypothetical protein
MCRIHQNITDLTMIQDLARRGQARISVPTAMGPESR